MEERAKTSTSISEPCSGRTAAAVEDGRVVGQIENAVRIVRDRAAVLHRQLAALAAGERVIRDRAVVVDRPAVEQQCRRRGAREVERAARLDLELAAATVLRATVPGVGATARDDEVRIAGERAAVLDEGRGSSVAF